ncbi:hypothetical protein INR49_008134 [Caranx melampygus]|nr:hypothetical protein INR49_008134 [Caranx melampygus]
MDFSDSSACSSCADAPQAQNSQVSWVHLGSTVILVSLVLTNGYCHCVKPSPCLNQVWVLLGVGLLQQSAPELPPLGRVDKHQLSIFDGQTVVDHHTQLNKKRFRPDRTGPDRTVTDRRPLPRHPPGLVGGGTKLVEAQGGWQRREGVVLEELPALEAALPQRLVVLIQVLYGPAVGAEALVLVPEALQGGRDARHDVGYWTKVVKNEGGSGCSCRGMNDGRGEEINASKKEPICVCCGESYSH